MARMRGTQDDGAGHWGDGLGHLGVESLKALTAAMIIVLDRNQAALELVRRHGSDHTVPADGSEVDKVLELTDGQSAEGVFDFSVSRVPRRRGGTGPGEQAPTTSSGTAARS
jgi:threonine dehydrogenase-like Zn-dependent dehydrogenase